MLRIFPFLLTFLLINKYLLSQKNAIEIKSMPGYSENDPSVIYYDYVHNTFRLNLQSGKTISRFLYDTSFSLLNEYKESSNDINLSKNSKSKLYFVTELIIEKSNFEIYTNDNIVEIYKPDFETKKDSLIYKFSLPESNKEKIIAILPQNNKLEILTSPSKSSIVYLYEWLPGSEIHKVEFILPESNLSKEEEKLYTKSCRINFKKELPEMIVHQVGNIYPIPSFGANYLYTSKKKIYFVLKIPFSVGICLIELDPELKQVKAKNFFVNDLKENVNADLLHIKSPIGFIFDSILVIENHSQLNFQYHFFDLTTWQEIKSFSVRSDSLYILVHSSLLQKGTYFSPNEEKEISKGKTFLRKAQFGFDFISLSSSREDSITFSFGSFIKTEGIEGTIFSLATMPIGYSANIHVGNIQMIPYLTLYRNKLLYAHSRFSKKTLAPSLNQNVTTVLDKMFEDLKVQKFAKNSSFMTKINETFYVGIFNSETKNFIISKYNNQ